MLTRFFQSRWIYLVLKPLCAPVRVWRREAYPSCSWTHPSSRTALSKSDTWRCYLLQLPMNLHLNYAWNPSPPPLPLCISSAVLFAFCFHQPSQSVDRPLYYPHCTPFSFLDIVKLNWNKEIVYPWILDIEVEEAKRTQIWKKILKSKDSLIRLR